MSQANIRFDKQAKRSAHLGMVGKTDNADNTPPHLHYSILTPRPKPWNYGKDNNPHKAMKMFYINPIPKQNKTFE